MREIQDCEQDSVDGNPGTPIQPGFVMKPPAKAPLPFFFLAFFGLFGCVGVAVLIFLWSPSHSFSGPPLIFKVVGSFIAMMFMVMGFGMPISAIKASRARKDARPAETEVGTSAGTQPTAGYRCPQCGAGLGHEQEVSPSGDVKCIYCKRWWNIHRAPV
jgi:DNA-directed RNA polymerase subunit RPC12/RpoP